MDTRFFQEKAERKGNFVLVAVFIYKIGDV